MANRGRWPRAVGAAALLCWLILPGCGDDRREKAEPLWHESLAEALAEAKAADRLVLVECWRPGCPYCEKLEAEVLTHPDFARAVKDRFILASINTRDRANSEMLRPYSGLIPGVPTVMVLRPDGDVVASNPGYLPLDRMLSWLGQVGR